MAAHLTLPARHDKMVETMLKLHKALPKAADGRGAAARVQA